MPAAPAQGQKKAWFALVWAEPPFSGPPTGDKHRDLVRDGYGMDIVARGQEHERHGAGIGLHAFSIKQAADREIRARLGLLAVERCRFGYRRLYVLLAREGVALNHKKMFRLYPEDRFGMRNPSRDIRRADPASRRWRIASRVNPSRSHRAEFLSTTVCS